MLIEAISSETGIEPDRLINFAKSASKKYFLFEVPKRTGGTRSICHPAKPLKSLQRWLNKRVISGWDTHQSATAYKQGSSIRGNAIRHIATNFTIRVDFKDFFPSFERNGIIEYFNINEQLSGRFTERDIEFFCDLVLRDNCLTIGAPTSPHLTNAMMFRFDSAVSAYCERRNLIYTRYADDIFVSSTEANKLSEAYAFVLEQASIFKFARLIINTEKTKFLSRRYRRSITGLILTPDRKLSIGRARKREIKALIHQFRTGHLEEERLSYLKGLIAFASDIEGNFLVSLQDKYGSDLLATITR